MSDKRVVSVCLVIDTSIAHAAGGFESKHPIGTMCRELLSRVLGIGHRMAFGERMKLEWNRHQSLFAGTWLVKMMTMNKLVPVDDEPMPDHLETMQQHAADPDLVAIMTKDAHLVAAAIRTGNRILSTDEKIRNHFAGKLRVHDEVMALAWVNPTIPDENAIEWLNEGAPMDARRTLRRFP
jgi:hypothetical protein